MPRHLALLPFPPELWLACSGPLPVMQRKLKYLQSQVVLATYHCENFVSDLSHARLLLSRSEAMGLSE